MPSHARRVSAAFRLSGSRISGEPHGNLPATFADQTSWSRRGRVDRQHGSVQAVLRQGAGVTPAGLVLPSGVYGIGRTLELLKNIDLHLDSGACLDGGGNR